MKESVCSWICVTAWKTETSRPTTRPTSSSGIATLKASSIASTAEADDDVLVMRGSSPRATG